MTDTSLFRKLHIVPGEKIAVVNSPAGFIRSLGDLPAAVILTETLSAPVDFALLFAQTSKDVERLVPEALHSLKPGSMFWVCYPRGISGVRTDLNRDILWRLMGKFKLAGVAMVSLDNVWSAMRFRPADMVGQVDRRHFRTGPSPASS